MKTYSKTDISRKLSEIIRATFNAPVVITDRRKPSHVFMTIEDYEDLLERAKKQE